MLRFATLCAVLAVACLSLVSASSFDPKEAQFYASLCAISYCKLDDIQAWNCPACNSSFTPRFVYSVPSTNQVAYVVDNSIDTTVVVFKGTEPLSWSQWATDFNLLKTDMTDLCGSECWVHGGFVSDFTALRDVMIEAMSKSLQNLPANAMQRKLVVTGHSLGAAMSTLFAFYVKRFMQLPVKQFSFGTPRIGDAGFANAYQATMYPNTFRVTHHADIVPHLPLESMGFEHEGRQIYCKDGLDCEELEGESDGGILHVSVEDHGVYMGISYFDYLDIGSQKGCHFG